MPKYAQYIGLYRFSAQKTQFLALSKAREGPLGTPDQYFQISMCSDKCYLPIPSHLRLKLALFYWLYPDKDIPQF